MEADQAYYDEHHVHLETCMNAAMQIIMREKPEDPCAKLAEFFAQQSTKYAQLACEPFASEVSDSWLIPWLISLKLHHAVAPLMPEDGSFDAIKALTCSELHEILRSAKLEGLAGTMWKGIEMLRGQSTATGDQLNSKFAATDGTFTLNYGGLNSFFQGLDGLVGPPNPNLAASIDFEHSSSPDSKSFFTTSNYGVTTSSQIEYAFVTNPLQGLEALGIEAWPAETKIPCERRRQPIELSTFDAKRCEYSARLQALDCAPVGVDELAALRLYTGPMWVALPLLLTAP